jgi:MFS family permease
LAPRVAQSGTVSSADSLIGLRAVIGFGAALVMPATLSTITGTFPAAQRVKAVSVWAGVAGGAAAGITGSPRRVRPSGRP